MKKPRALELVPPREPAPLAPPPDRGRLLSAAEVACNIFNGTVSALWVTRNVVTGKVRLGHVKRAWWEYDVRRWLEGRTNTGEAA